MQKLRIKIAIIALVLGVGSAFASVHRVDGVRWGLDPDTQEWVQVTGDYACINSGTCTRVYPLNHDPNDDPSGFSDQESGTFIQ